jgi:hypothetical protein
LFLMTEIFQQTSDSIAGKLGFVINKKEQQNTLTYLKKLHDEAKHYR